MTAQVEGNQVSTQYDNLGGPSIGDQARDTYRALRNSGLSDTDIMAFAGELLSLVATGVRSTAAAE